MEKINTIFFQWLDFKFAKWNALTLFLLDIKNDLLVFDSLMAKVSKEDANERDLFFISVIQNRSKKKKEDKVKWISSFNIWIFYSGIFKSHQKKSSDYQICFLPYIEYRQICQQRKTIRNQNDSTSSSVLEWCGDHPRTLHKRIERTEQYSYAGSIWTEIC